MADTTVSKLLIIRQMHDAARLISFQSKFWIAWTEVFLNLKEKMALIAWDRGPWSYSIWAEGLILSLSPGLFSDSIQRIHKIISNFWLFRETYYNYFQLIPEAVYGSEAEVLITKGFFPAKPCLVGYLLCKLQPSLDNVLFIMSSTFCLGVDCWGAQM